MFVDVLFDARDDVLDPGAVVYVGVNMLIDTMAVGGKVLGDSIGICLIAKFPTFVYGCCTVGVDKELRFPFCNRPYAPIR